MSRVNAALVQAAQRAGLEVTHYSPGDGLRIRFHLAGKGADYFDGSELFTACGQPEARAWLAGFMAGRLAQQLRGGVTA